MKFGNFDLMKKLNEKVTKGEIRASFCNCSQINAVHITVNRNNNIYEQIQKAKLVAE